MNGKLAFNKIQDLNAAEKMELFAFSYTTPSQALRKLMEMLIVNARDEAMEIEPSKKLERDCAMDTAHAMHKFYVQLWQLIGNYAGEHLEERDAKAQAELLQDREQVEAIILSNSR